MAEQCVIHGTFKESIMNVLKGKCLRLFERDEDSGVLTHRSCQKKTQKKTWLIVLTTVLYMLICCPVDVSVCTCYGGCGRRSLLLSSRTFHK